jgi:hypothetical protein
MLSQRVVTSLAIVFGGVLGSAAALVGGGREHAPEEPLPFAPLGRGAAGDGELIVRPETAVPPPPRTVPATTTARDALTSRAPAPSGVEAVKSAELDCARGDGLACLDAADAFRDARGVEADPERARMLTGLGVQQFALRCMDRVPAACLVAKLHKVGRGVPQDGIAANALVDRATMLCRAKPSAPGCPGEAR